MRSLLIGTFILLGAKTFAGTIEQIVKADCSAEDGSYFKLDREAEVVETRFAELPDLVNLSDGERMPIETHDEGDTHKGVGALVVNFETGLFGSVSLIAESEKTLSENETLLVVFRDMMGNFATDNLNCVLKFN